MNDSADRRELGFRGADLRLQPRCLWSHHRLGCKCNWERLLEESRRAETPVRHETAIAEVS